MRKLYLQTAIAFIVTLAQAFAAPQSVLTVSRTIFPLDSNPFPYTGLSFFKHNSCACRQWLEKFGSDSMNALRVRALWDNKRGFCDASRSSCLYFDDGRLRQQHVEPLKQIVAGAGSLGQVDELTLFSHESWHDGIRLSPPAADRAVAALTEEQRPYRNVAFQIWNEFSERTLDDVKTIRKIDPQRLAATSPGGSGALSTNAEETEALDHHKAVFEFIRLRDRFVPEWYGRR